MSSPVAGIDGSLLSQLAFVLLAVLAWIMREAAERKQARSERAEPHPDQGPAGAEARQRAVAVMPPALTPPALPDGSLPPPPPPAARQRVHARAADQEVGALAASLATPKVAAPPVAAPPARHPGRSAWARLGLPAGGNRLDALRTAVLWREVLGPPRAMRGPHRPPSQRRHG